MSDGRATGFLQRCISSARHATRRQALKRQRAVADEWLLWGALPRAHSPLLAWRAEELTSQRNRQRLARLCRRFIAELSDPRCRAYATNRPAMRAHYRGLVELADRLEDPDRAVSPAGVALAERLLADGPARSTTPAAPAS